MKVDLKDIPDDGIVTWSGRIVTPLHPLPEQFCIDDIAHSLANQCRFTGHTRKFYSVAQHSVLVSQICDYPDALAGLLHDATEAYISDIARPLKKQEGFGDLYCDAEYVIARAIGVKFGVNRQPLPLSVKYADSVMLSSEIRDLMSFEPYPGDLLDYEIVPWAPDVAEFRFMDRYYELSDAKQTSVV